MAEHRKRRHIAYDLGYLEAGRRVSVPLSGTECNVFIVTPSDYAAYKNWQQYHYVGRLFKQSPASIVVPHAARWTLVIDLGGAAGNVRAGQPRVA